MSVTAGARTWSWAWARPRGWRLATAVSVVLLGVGARLLRAADAANTPAQSSAAQAATGDGAALVHAMNKFYGALGGVSAQSTVSMESDMLPVKVELKLSFGAERPNRIAAHTLSGMGGGDVVCDHDTLFVSMPALKRYTIDDAPRTFTDLMQLMPPVAPGLDVLLGLLTGTAFTDSNEPFTVVGNEEVDGTICRHLQQRRGPSQVDLWIDSGAQPWLRRCLRVRESTRPSQSGQTPGDPAGKGDSSRAALLQDFSAWKGAPPPRDEFKIHRPSDFKHTETIFPTAAEMQAAMGGSGAGAGGQAGATGSAGMGGAGEMLHHPTEGQPAQTFVLDRLSGGQIDLSKHLGKEVIVLDFWATWCRPCLMAMPVIERVTESMADQGVVLIAVDMREAPEHVAQFAQSRGLKTTVALDKDGHVGESYGVTGIPHTVLIDRKGRIARVFIGFRPDLEQSLQEILRALAAEVPAPPPAGAKGSATAKQSGS